MSRKTRGIRISDDLELPIELVTGTQAILAKKGAGKTYKGSVQAEEMLELGQQIVVLDPTGPWWGLRSSADGASVGYPITIFGGKHGDVPLEPTAGEVLAEAVVNDGFSAIIDLTSFTKGEEQRFCAAFLEALYRRNEKPLHLFLDEADVFAPQRPFGDEARTLGACQSIVRRGRIKGIGCTLITQRPQVLNKDVLSQVDMLTVLRMNHPKDIGAIDEWVAVHGDPKLAKDMMASLPSLPKGDAWVWAPGDDLFRRVTYRDRRTFDSGRTPKAGEKVLRPKVLAHVDLERLGETIKATVERAKANDPKELKKRIATLEHELERERRAVDELAAQAVEKAPAADPRRVRDIADAFGGFSKLVLEQLVPIAAQLQAVERNVGAMLRDARAGGVTKVPAYVAPPVSNFLAPVQRDTMRRPLPKVAGTIPGRVSGSITIKRGGYDPSLGPKHPSNRDETLEQLPDGERAILSAAIQHGGVTREQLSVLCGYKRSSRNTYVQRLQSKGLVIVDDRDGTIAATEKGAAALPDIDALPVGEELRKFWRGKLPDGERVILDELMRAYPASVPRDAIGESAGYKRSSRNTYVQKLVARQLATTGRDGVRASDTLFGIG